MAQTVFDFTDGVSGFVSRNSFGGFGVGTGAVNCVVENDYAAPAPPREKRAMFQFDTSSLPDTATVTQVEFFVEEAAVQHPTPPNQVLLYIGNWIGAVLQANLNDYSGGNSMSLDILPFGTSVWIDLATFGGNPIPYIDLTGTTDIALRGGFSGGVTQARAYNQVKVKCQLRVTYSVPGSRLTMMGAG